MSARFLRADLLNRQLVRDREGVAIGHLHELCAREVDGELVVTEYHLGRGALMHRFGIPLLHLFGFRAAEPIRIPWDRLDLSDPGRPRFDGLADEVR